MGSQETLGEVQGIGAQEADNLLHSNATMLDVREASEWQAGHVPGALHVPLGELESSLGTLPRDQRLIVICRSGHRSAKATALLVRSGFDAVNLNGGIVAWASTGLPVENDDAMPGTVV